MKTKKFNKRLNLNKITIANLDHSEMKVIKGGSSTLACTHGCPKTFTWCGIDCPD